MLNKKHINWSVFAIGVVIFALIYIFNILYPLYADDWSYQFISGANRGDRIAGLSDILTSQYNHYFEWGGRSVVHVIAQALLYIEDPLADFLNSFIFVLLLFIIYSISNRKNNVTSLFILPYSFILLWFFTPAFFANVLWITGSSNYLWGMVIVLYFIFFYIKSYAEGKFQKDNILKYILFFIGGIIAGWTNENIGASIIFFIIGIIILSKYNKQNIPYWMIIGLAGIILGYSLMLLAPGNYIRLEIVHNQYPETAYFYTRLMGVLKSYKYMFILDSIYVLLAIYIFKKGIYNKENKFLQLSILFLLTAHVAIFVMIASPFFPPRAWFGIIVFTIISILLLYTSLPLDKKVIKVVNSLTVTIALVLFSISYYQKHKVLYAVSKLWDERNLYTIEQQKQGKKDLVFDKTYTLHRRYFLDDLSVDPNDWRNIAYSNYYKINSAKVDSTATILKLK